MSPEGTWTTISALGVETVERKLNGQGENGGERRIRVRACGRRGEGNFFFC